ncbi:MAG: hypothetical protein PHX61_09115 [Alphaproteobacteria bacterium]|nr:hypothetical protein [Alphaproteobacteria bacterium]
MSKNFNAFCKSPLTDAETVLLEQCFDGKSDYHRKIKGTKTSLFLTLLRAEESPYQAIEGDLLTPYTLDHVALDRLFNLADHMSDICSGGLRANKQKGTALLKSIELDLMQFRAHQTKLLKFTEQDMADLEKKQNTVVANFKRACEGKDWETLSWLYFDAMKPTPKSLESLPENENIIQFPQKDTGNKEGLNKLMQKFNHIPKLKLGDVLDQIGEPPILTHFAIFTGRCEDRIKIFETIIGFLTEMQDAVSVQIHPRSSLMVHPTQAASNVPVKLSLVR